MKKEDFIRILSSNEVLYRKKELQDYLVNNYSPSLINSILSIDNPIVFERFTNIMQYTIDVSEIDEKRDDFIKNIILNKVDNNKEIFTLFNDITIDNYRDFPFTDNEIYDIEIGIKHNNFDDVLRKISNNWMTNYIIYYFYHDNYYNFLVNLNQMLRYFREINLNLMNSEHLSFYIECYNLSKLSFKDQIEFFKKNYNKQNFQSMFYDDMRIVKNHSYQNLINNSLKINESKNLYNEELSKEYHVPVYFLDGESFHALIRCITPNNGRSKEEYSKYINSQKDNKDYYSFSYISDRNITSIRGNSYTFLYSDINPENIVHVYHDDASSSKLLRQKHFLSDKYNEIHSPNTLVRDTNYYNEIVIKKEEGGIKPSALVCFDEIKKEEVDLANEYNLPILLINSKKYYQKMGYTDFNDYDTYSI